MRDWMNRKGRKKFFKWKMGEEEFELIESIGAKCYFFNFEIYVNFDLSIIFCIHKLYYLYLIDIDDLIL